MENPNKLLDRIDYLEKQIPLDRKRLMVINKEKYRYSEISDRIADATIEIRVIRNFLNQSQIFTRNENT